jgi:hypothetical protein
MYLFLELKICSVFPKRQELEKQNRIDMIDECTSMGQSCCGQPMTNLSARERNLRVHSLK